uniref:Uncharacterized protein n=1 Tax=Timema cristinae TaxID=61476 RepID=A0A7R9CYR9_TIMCR|nr:unnamed protein product [Timema cristinae]
MTSANFNVFPVQMEGDIDLETRLQNIKTLERKYIELLKIIHYLATKQRQRPEHYVLHIQDPLDFTEQVFIPAVRWEKLISNWDISVLEATSKILQTTKLKEEYPHKISRLRTIGHQIRFVFARDASTSEWKRMNESGILNLNRDLLGSV